MIKITKQSPALDVYHQTDSETALPSPLDHSRWLCMATANSRHNPPNRADVQIVLANDKTKTVTSRSNHKSKTQVNTGIQVLASNHAQKQHIKHLWNIGDVWAFKLQKTLSMSCEVSTNKPTSMVTQESESHIREPIGESPIERDINTWVAGEAYGIVGEVFGNTIASSSLLRASSWCVMWPGASGEARCRNHHQHMETSGVEWNEQWRSRCVKWSSSTKHSTRWQQ